MTIEFNTSRSRQLPLDRASLRIALPAHSTHPTLPFTCSYSTQHPSTHHIKIYTHSPYPLYTKMSTFPHVPKGQPRNLRPRPRRPHPHSHPHLPGHLLTVCTVPMYLFWLFLWLTHTLSSDARTTGQLTPLVLGVIRFVKGAARGVDGDDQGGTVSLWLSYRRSWMVGFDGP